MKRMIDIDSPVYSQRQTAECTRADMKTLDNYIQHGHIQPHRENGRRLFTIRDMITVEVIAVLAGVFNIPPMIGGQIARSIVSQNGSLIETEAAIDPTEDWVRQSHRKAFSTIERLSDGSVSIISEDDAAANPHSVMLVIPLQLLTRSVLFKTHRLEAAQAQSK